MKVVVDGVLGEIWSASVIFDDEICSKDFHGEELKHPPCTSCRYLGVVMDCWHCDVFNYYVREPESHYCGEWKEKDGN